MMDGQASVAGENHAAMILPGATIGMVGGGQLGRMFAIAASSMGYDVVVLCERSDAPAAQVAHRVITGPLDDPRVTAEFASQCDVITLEFENIPAETISLCGQHAPTYPSASVLATAQDRLLEKRTLRDSGLPVTPFVEVEDAGSVIGASESLGWPIIIKTARSGYDGKGQHKIESAQQATQTPWDSCQRWIAEQCIAFDREVSVIIARTAGGQAACFPIFQNTHRDHILDLTVAPAPISGQLAERAREIATHAAETLGVVGLLCVELFVQGDDLLINEVAPRPHNSGHLTIEACQTSQFEQHVRAVCNLPLGSTELRCGAAAMANLLGDLWHNDGRQPNWDKALAVPGISLHLYGKRVAKSGRKMGHLTATGDDRDEVAERVCRARAMIARSL